MEIRIYDLKKGKLIAMRKAFGTIKDESTKGEGTDINLALPSKGIVRNGINRIVDYFKKNSKPE